MIDPHKFDVFMDRAMPFTLMATLWFLMILMGFVIFTGGGCD